MSPRLHKRIGTCRSMWSMSESRLRLTVISDAHFADHADKKVWAMEMSCPWLDYHQRKEEEKMGKYMYGPFGRS